MRKSLLIIISIFLSFPIFAKDVSIDRARKVASAFLQQSTATTLKSAKQIELTLVTDFLTDIQGTNIALKSAGTDSPEMFAFNINQNKGFIIVSGDDAAFPILAYSDEQGITTSGLPPNIASWLDHYRQQIRFLKEHKVEPTEDVKRQWDGVYSRLKSAQNSVAPLITTKWNQETYFNAKCPYDSVAKKRTPTGCGATAMAQILKFWEYPLKGFGFHTDWLKKYGTLSADFDTTRYNWAAMPVKVTAPNDAVATLMYHCGVAMDMLYDVDGSSASLLYKPELPDRKYALIAFRTFFGYSSSIQGITRNYGHDISEWNNVLKSELGEGRPVFYDGFDADEKVGHGFICDGYDDQDNFHFNWGWGGLSDGYFRLDAMIPLKEVDLNYHQKILIGIKPPENALTYQLIINSPVEINKSEIEYGERFNLSTDILNKGSLDFKGDFCATIFDEQFCIVDTVEIKIGQSLASGTPFSDGISFSSNRLSTMVPGTYRAYIRYRSEGGEWIILQTDMSDNLTKNYVEIKVSNKNNICLSAPINVQQNIIWAANLIDSFTLPIYPNDSLSVWLNIANDSTKNFTGTLNLLVYTLDGDFVTTIEEKPNINLASKSHFVDSIRFHTSKLELAPGNYLLKLMHKWDGSTYELTGSNDLYSNPIVLTVTAPIEKDQYEDNDSPYQVADLPVIFNNNTALVKTKNANIHIKYNLDFYSITLKSGYNYAVNARIQDIKNSNDGQSYSLDVVLIYSTDGITPSPEYDDLITDTIKTSGAGKVFFIVASNTLGGVGSYSLNIQIARKLNTEAVTTVTQDSFQVYPNPFTDKVTITGNDTGLKYELFDIQGRLLKKDAIPDRKNVLDFSNLGEGVYFLKMISEKRIQTEKVIKL